MCRFFQVVGEGLDSRANVLVTTDVLFFGWTFSG